LCHKSLRPLRSRPGRGGRRLLRPMARCAPRDGCRRSGTARSSARRRSGSGSRAVGTALGPTRPSQVQRLGPDRLLPRPPVAPSPCCPVPLLPRPVWCPPLKCGPGHLGRPCANPGGARRRGARCSAPRATGRTGAVSLTVADHIADHDREGPHRLRHGRSAVQSAGIDLCFGCQALNPAVGRLGPALRRRRAIHLEVARAPPGRRRVRGHLGGRVGPYMKQGDARVGQSRNDRRSVPRHVGHLCGTRHGSEALAQGVGYAELLVQEPTVQPLVVHPEGQLLPAQVATKDPPLDLPALRAAGCLQGAPHHP